jgi:hypothetical protein
MHKQHVEVIVHDDRCGPRISAHCTQENSRVRPAPTTIAASDRLLPSCSASSRLAAHGPLRFLNSTLQFLLDVVPPRPSWAIPSPCNHIMNQRARKTQFFLSCLLLLSSKEFFLHIEFKYRCEKNGQHYKVLMLKYDPKRKDWVFR